MDWGSGASYQSTWELRSPSDWKTRPTIFRIFCWRKRALGPTLSNGHLSPHKCPRNHSQKEKRQKQRNNEVRFLRARYSTITISTSMGIVISQSSRAILQTYRDVIFVSPSVLTKGITKVKPRSMHQRYTSDRRWHRSIDWGWLLHDTHCGWLPLDINSHTAFDMGRFDTPSNWEHPCEVRRKLYRIASYANISTPEDNTLKHGSHWPKTQCIHFCMWDVHIVPSWCNQQDWNYYKPILWWGYAMKQISRWEALLLQLFYYHLQQG